jgi:tetratricopeptide (TPR) repeat protein
MTHRHGWFVVCLFLTVGALASAEPEASPPAEQQDEQSEAVRLWEQGQEAMLHGNTDAAISLYQKSLKQEQGLARNYLSLAAAFLEKNEDEVAALYMDHYLQLQPDHLMARYHYATLLLRLKQPAAARKQLEHFIADIQDCEELANQHLVNCHSRLMEIAEADEDDYAEHLHRGIGLFRLACRRGELAPEVKAPDVESLLCRAAGELTLARQSKPDEARPSWYLYEVWTRLAQSQPAHRCLCAAETAAECSYLTPVEKRGLQLALRSRSGERQRK